MPLWFEMLVLMELTCAAGFAAGWLVWRKRGNKRD